MQLLLDGFCGDKPWQTFTLERDQLAVFGRTPDSHITIPSISVSRFHHDLQWNGCRVLLRDRNSRSGMHVNNQEVGGGITVLRLGDVIRICDYRFRLRAPVKVPSAWLVWNDSTIPRMAQAIYDDRAFDRVPILADALEDAGCDNAGILNHCREPREHVCGCWVVDLLLGKQ